METNILEYALTAIFLIIIKKKEVHPVTFYSYTFRATKINYNIHNKELLMVFEAFYMQYYYLEESELPIAIIMNHKNPEYFSTTKILSYCQARWLESLSLTLLSTFVQDT